MIQLPFLHEKIDNGSILLEHYEVKEAVANGYVCHRRDHDTDYLLKPVAANLDKQDAQELQQNASKLSEILIHQNIAHILLAAKDEKTDAFFTVAQTAQGEKLKRWADGKREIPHCKLPASSSRLKATPSSMISTCSRCRPTASSNIWARRNWNGRLAICRRKSAKGN